MGVQAVLVVLLVFASTVKSKKGGVEFWRNNVTLTCPGYGTWYDNEKQIHEGKTLQIEYKRQLKYRCEYKELNITVGEINHKYFFYVKGRACENCFEVDASFIGLAIVVNVTGTAVAMMFIFRRTKNRSSDGPSRSSQPPLPSRSRPQTSQQGTYQELQSRSRAANTYASVNRMG